MLCKVHITQDIILIMRKFISLEIRFFESYIIWKKYQGGFEKKPMIFVCILFVFY